MLNNTPFRIRRAIVRALFNYAGAQDLDTVAAHPAVTIENPPVELLRQEWDVLAAAGIIQLLPGYAGGVAKLSPGIRQKMEQNHAGNPPPLPVLYGPEVM